MRNVTRPTQAPDSLINHGADWSEDLLRRIEEFENGGLKVTDYYYNHYNQPDVKETLLKMYNGLCCYCESVIDEVVDEDVEQDDKRRKYGHIEHRYPKRKYPELTFNWNNLHIACNDCNTAKGNKFNENYPILDPASDIPISTHISYTIESEDGVAIEWKTERGETTVKDTDLNRPSLKKIARLKIFLKTLNTIKKINENNNKPNVRFWIGQLEELCNEEYGSVIKWAMESYLLI